MKYIIKRVLIEVILLVIFSGVVCVSAVFCTLTRKALYFFTLSSCYICYISQYINSCIFLKFTMLDVKNLACLYHGIFFFSPQLWRIVLLGILIFVGIMVSRTWNALLLATLSFKVTSTDKLSSNVIRVSFICDVSCVLSFS